MNDNNNMKFSFFDNYPTASKMDELFSDTVLSGTLENKTFALWCIFKNEMINSIGVIQMYHLDSYNNIPGVLQKMIYNQVRLESLLNVCNAIWLKYTATKDLNDSIKTVLTDTYKEKSSTPTYPEQIYSMTNTVINKIEAAVNFEIHCKLIKTIDAPGIEQN